MSQIIRKFAVIEVIAGTHVSARTFGRPIHMVNGVSAAAGQGQRAFGVVVVPAPAGEPMSVAVCGSGQVVKVKLSANTEKGDLLMVAEDGAMPFTVPDEWHQAWTCAVALEDGSSNTLIEALLTSPMQIIDPNA